MSEITKSIGVSYKRTNPVPLDKSAVAKDTTDAEAILLSPTAYAGQVVITKGGDIHPKTDTGDNALCATTPVVFRSNNTDELYTDYYKRILAEGEAGGRDGFMHARFGPFNIDVYTAGGLLRQRSTYSFPYESYAATRVNVSKYNYTMFECKLPSNEVEYRVQSCVRVLMSEDPKTYANVHFEFDLSSDRYTHILIPKFNEEQYALLPTTLNDANSGVDYEGLAFVAWNGSEWDYASLSSTAISNITFRVTEICVNTAFYSGG